MHKEHKFITYNRTLMLFRQRYRNTGTDNSVSITQGDLQRFKVSPALLHHFIKSGQISHTNNRFTALTAGAVDLSLIQRKGAKQTDLHRYMKQCLLMVNLPEQLILQPEVTDYFRLFLELRKQHLDLFFTVDSFSGRVHTPVSSLHHSIRPGLILCGEPVVSFDVSQMQPTLLGNILYQNIGNNSFTEAINNGTDIYTMLQEKAGLNDRNEAKKRLFQMLFSKPSNDLQQLFGNADFIQWINQYKSINEPRNPHGKAKPHSNLAWLLQSYEVKIMSEVWRTLAETATHHLSIHDEIICRRSDSETARTIIEKVLNKHFTYYKLNEK